MIKQGFDSIMFTQKDWLDLAKGRLHIRSDYALAKRWDVSASEVSQYRRDRLRLPLAVISPKSCDATQWKSLPDLNTEDAGSRTGSG